MPEEDETPSRARPRSWLSVALVAALAVGAVAFVVTRDTWKRTGPPITVASWAPYWQTNAAYESFDANADLFGDVSIVAFQAVGDNGDIRQYERLAVDATSRFATRAQSAGVPLLATIFDDTAAGVMARILGDPTTRTAHVRAVAAIVLDNGFDGVDLDYEQFAFSDARSTWATTSPSWIAFLEELTTILHAQDKLVVVSVPSTAYTVYAHEEMGAIVDLVRLMAYDYSTSEPGPIAPAEWVRRIVDELKDVMPAEKIDLGVPAYGRDWPVATSGTCPAEAETGRGSVTPSRAESLAAEHGATVMWDEEAEEARFDYSVTFTGADAAGTTVTCTVSRTVWFLNAQAFHRRAWIAHRADLHGIAIWALGNDDPSLWSAIRTAREGEADWPGPTLPPAPTDPPSTT